MHKQITAIGIVELPGGEKSSYGLVDQWAQSTAFDSSADNALIGKGEVLHDLVGRMIKLF